MLSVKQAHYHYHSEAFDFSLQVDQGDIVALMGPSGAGKSTLLALLAGFIEPASGKILAAGQSLVGKAPHQRPVAMLFQEHNLFAHLTVGENIGLGLHPGLKLSAEQKRQVAEAAQQVGVGDYLERLPEQLSGGQRQRVALARCFVQPHQVWLLDEPFSALDPLLREEMLMLVKRLAKERQLTVVMVTHHISDARSIASHFAFVANGRVEVTDKIEQLSAEHHNLALAAFVKAGH
ncbi:putative thiamine ABC transporter, ATP-binding protein [Vibrio ichthyoenteri ATCC 700023]|uniref:Putative thiamine ABC transporter, ATP-binding protein n=1 Tax=Vibrio ichthyoenteri ATCC 700023 TaxID=870968 RepID=F9S553_9VIBR|nr:thiamine ABC transporter ATP-binding protein [Vibrio ichthyoenteri]EGU36131.1 putative thiamine ABC transporter, ATP-binding protein [Vibrio ichthyoenteri ATCC 700023]